MATKIEAWRAADGSLHASEKLATEQDVHALAVKIVSTNQTATALASKLCENADEAIRVLQAYAKCHPKAKAPEPTGEKEVRVCSRCGRIEGEPHPFRHFANYVPASEAPFWTKSHPIDEYTMQEVVSEQVTGIIRAAADEDRDKTRTFIRSLGVDDLAELSKKPELFKKAYSWAHNNFFVRSRELEMSAAPMPETPMPEHP